MRSCSMLPIRHSRILAFRSLERLYTISLKKGKVNSFRQVFYKFFLLFYRLTVVEDCRAVKEENVLVLEIEKTAGVVNIHIADVDQG